MSYRVRRDLPNNTRFQLRSTTLPECQALLESLRRKWADLADTGTFGGREAYTVTLKGKTLTVTQGDKLVDKYVIEKAS